jgi:hypothetical protein
LSVAWVTSTSVPDVCQITQVSGTPETIDGVKGLVAEALRAVGVVPIATAVGVRALRCAVLVPESSEVDGSPQVHT